MNYYFLLAILLPVLLPAGIILLLGSSLRGLEYVTEHMVCSVFNNIVQAYRRHLLVVLSHFQRQLLINYEHCSGSLELPVSSHTVSALAGTQKISGGVIFSQ